MFAATVDAQRCSCVTAFLMDSSTAQANLRRPAHVCDVTKAAAVSAACRSLGVDEHLVFDATNKHPVWKFVRVERQDNGVFRRSSAHAQDVRFRAQRFSKLIYGNWAGDAMDDTYGCFRRTRLVRFNFYATQGCALSKRCCSLRIFRFDSEQVEPNVATDGEYAILGFILQGCGQPYWVQGFQLGEAVRGYDDNNRSQF